jgi:hypothetical protein
MGLLNYSKLPHFIWTCIQNQFANAKVFKTKLSKGTPRDFLHFSSFSTYLQPVAASVSGINDTAKRKTQSCGNRLLPVSATPPTTLSQSSVTIEEPKLRNISEVIKNFED